MGDEQRHRIEPPKRRYGAVDEDTVIEIGDNVYLDGDDFKPASDFPWDTDEETTQEAIVPDYGGVALSRSREGDTDPIAMASGGIVEFDCVSDTYEAGEYVGISENDDSDGLMNQRVTAVSDGADAIGTVYRSEPSNTTSVLVEIHAPLWRGVVLNR